MYCRVEDLKHKEVINSENGCRIGFADDVEIDTLTACVKAIVVFGRPRCFGIMGKYEDVIIPWCDIKLIGEDTILVCSDVNVKQKKQKQNRMFS